MSFDRYLCCESPRPAGTKEGGAVLSGDDADRGESPTVDIGRRLFLASAAAISAASVASANQNIGLSEGPLPLYAGWKKAGAEIERDPGFSGVNPPSSEVQRVADLIVANHILADQDFNDMFGHVSVRSYVNPERYYMSQARAPELVVPGDIMQFDLASRPIDLRGRNMYEERFIHGEIYRRRPDVLCVIHSHTPAVIPFGVTDVPLRPLLHVAAYLQPEVPVFEIRDVDGDDNGMLVNNPRSGAALAKTLGEGTAVLMRGHGCTVVGPNVRLAVYHALYLKKNAEAQLMSSVLANTQGRGEVKFLNAHERRNFGAKLEQMGTPEIPLRGWPVWERHALANLEYLLRS